MALMDFTEVLSVPELLAEEVEEFALDFESVRVTAMTAAAATRRITEPPMMASFFLAMVRGGRVY